MTTLKRIEAAIGKPQGATQVTAKTLTDFASLMAPTPAGKAKAATTVGRIGLRALDAALPAAIKSGGDPQETAVAAGVGGGASLASKLGRAVLSGCASRQGGREHRRRAPGVSEERQLVRPPDRGIRVEARPKLEVRRIEAEMPALEEAMRALESDPSAELIRSGVYLNLSGD